MHKSGYTEDVEKLIVSLIPQLRCYAHSLTRDNDRAEDLVQDCLQRAFEKIHLWQEGTNMRAWLFTIMHNLHATYAKRFNTGPKFVPIESSFQANEPVTVSNTDGSNQIRDLEAALSTLSQEHRELIHLVCVEELKYEEVADILELPVGTVMSRLHRAREKLRVYMFGGPKANIRRIK